jgi:hypothetical protein
MQKLLDVLRPFGKPSVRRALSHVAVALDKGIAREQDAAASAPRWNAAVNAMCGSHVR